MRKADVGLSEELVTHNKVNGAQNIISLLPHEEKHIGCSQQWWPLAGLLKGNRKHTGRATGAVRRTHLVRRPSPFSRVSWRRRVSVLCPAVGHFLRGLLLTSSPVSISYPGGNSTTPEDDATVALTQQVLLQFNVFVLTATGSVAASEFIFPQVQHFTLAWQCSTP